MKRKLVLASISAIGAAGVIAGAAYAAIPDSDGVIHSCYSTTTGVLRAVEPTAKCRSGETSLVWNQTGPQGPAGPQGQAGPTGPAGASDVYLATHNATVPLDGSATVVTLSLPAGYYVLTGQATIENGDQYSRSAGCLLNNDAHKASSVEISRGGFGTLTVHDALTASEPMTLTMSCSTFHGTAFDSKLTALKVTSIHE